MAFLQGLFGPPDFDVLKSKRDTRGLIRALQHKNAHVRAAAARALGDLRLTEGAGALVESLADPEDTVHQAAAASLTELGVLALDALSAALNNPLYYVRKRAIEILGDIRDANTVGLLCELLMDANREVREAAADALSKQGACAIDALAAALQYGGRVSPAIAAWALGIIQDARALEPLAAALAHPDVEVRHAAARALGRVGGTAAIEPLIAALQSNELGTTAVEALIRIGPAAIGKLQEGLVGENARARRAAFQVLDQLAAQDDPVLQPWRVVARRDWAGALALGQPAVRPLVDTLLDPDPKVRTRAAHTLNGFSRADISHAWVVDALTKALQDEYADVRFEAAKALGSARLSRDPTARAWRAVARQDWQRAIALGDAALIPLTALLTDRDPEIRSAAGKALKRLGVPCDLDVQIRCAIATGDWQAVETHGTLAIGPLLEIIEKTDSSQHYFLANAAWALGNIGDLRATDTLLRLAQVPYGRVSRSAIISLGKLQDARLIDTILSYADDPRCEGPDAVVSALACIGQPAIESLVMLLAKYTDSNTEVSIQVLNALSDLNWQPASDLNWQPASDRERRAFLAVRSALAEKLARSRDWNGCVKVGAPAIDVLLRRLHRGGLAHRRDVALALKAIYRGGKLDAGAKSRILAQRRAMEQEHTDRNYTKVVREHQDHSAHYDHHTDQGIGCDIHTDVRRDDWHERQWGYPWTHQDFFFGTGREEWQHDDDGIGITL